jgi:hypothetical protein
MNGCARAFVVCLAMGSWLPGCGEREEGTPGRSAKKPAEIATAPRAERTRRPSVHDLFATPPKSDYEAAVTTAIKVVVYAESLQPFCSRWFPALGRKSADAYLIWRERNAASIGDVKTHALKLWESRAGEHKAVAIRVYAALRNQADQLLLREFDASPVKEFEEICAGLPRDILSPDWNLERKLGAELALIRASRSSKIRPA